ncbi:hypothetical protein IAQ61_008436 [Plenodomus lingam]|uniref:uncharacterized protein n=1 Tax=Leptosphaeria maculans TaxID=5022 RepID=UPI003324111F|nr:hypothetical protein IAQ61_008436 [Plenodomus lingam]
MCTAGSGFKTGHRGCAIGPGTPSSVPFVECGHVSCLLRRSFTDPLVPARCNARVRDEGGYPILVLSYEAENAATR